CGREVGYSNFDYW
nr:immunoglobulin heavy chain junction region [Macaca mulatta]